MSYHQRAASDMLLAFPTPILTAFMEGTESVNRALRDIVLARAGRDSHSERSNIGGWHSDLDFFSWPHEEVQQVRLFAQMAIDRMSTFLGGDKIPDGELFISGWANVLYQGSYNAPHSHPASMWSGVYYVDVGSPSDDDSLSGVIEFLDPRSGVNMVVVPGDPFDGTLRVHPKSGTLLLFPAWLTHHVHVCQSPETRISIAFNASRGSHSDDFPGKVGGF